MGGEGAGRGAQTRARKQHSVYHASKKIKPRKSADVRSRRAEGREDGVRARKQSSDDQALPIKTGRALDRSQVCGAQDGVAEQKTPARTNPPQVRKSNCRVPVNNISQVRGRPPFSGHDRRVSVSTNRQRHRHLSFYWVRHGWRLTETAPIRDNVRAYVNSPNGCVSSA